MVKYPAGNESISHLEKENHQLKSAFGWGYVSSWEGRLKHDLSIFLTNVHFHGALLEVPVRKTRNARTHRKLSMAKTSKFIQLFPLPFLLAKAVVSR